MDNTSCNRLNVALTLSGGGYRAATFHLGVLSYMDSIKIGGKSLIDSISKHSKKCTFYTLRFGCSFAAVNTIKPQLL